MSEILRIGGLSLILVSALVFSKEYGRYLKGRVELCQGFLLLLIHIRSRVDCYLTPLPEAISGFESPALSGCGFLQKAKDEGLSSAYFSMEKSLSLPERARAILTPFFRGLGREYREGTLRELSSAISALEGALVEEREESEKSLKIARILAVSAALGAIILII